MSSPTTTATPTKIANLFNRAQAVGNTPDGSLLANNTYEDPAKKIDFEQVFGLFRQDWIYDFFFSDQAERDTYDELKFGLKNQDLEAVHYKMTSLDNDEEGSKTTFSMSEASNILVVPSFTTGYLSLSLIIDECVHTNNSLFSSSNCIARSVRNDADAIFIFISQDSQCGIVEFSYFKLLSPVLRKTIFFQCHFDKFRMFIEKIHQTKQIDRQQLYASLICFTSAYHSKSCEKCNILAGDLIKLCTCKLHMKVKRHPLDQATENHNLSYYLGNSTGQSLISLYGSPGQLSVSSSFNSECSTSASSDPDLVERLSKWGLEYASAKRMQRSSNSDLDMKYLLQKVGRGSSGNPINAFTLAAILQNANDKIFRSACQFLPCIANPLENSSNSSSTNESKTQVNSSYFPSNNAFEAKITGPGCRDSSLSSSSLDFSTLFPLTKTDGMDGISNINVQMDESIEKSSTKLDNTNGMNVDTGTDTTIGQLMTESSTIVVDTGMNSQDDNQMPWMSLIIAEPGIESTLDKNNLALNSINIENPSLSSSALIPGNPSISDILKDSTSISQHLKAQDKKEKKTNKLTMDTSLNSSSVTSNPQSTEITKTPLQSLIPPKIVSVKTAPPPHVLTIPVPVPANINENSTLFTQSASHQIANTTVNVPKSIISLAPAALPSVDTTVKPLAPGGPIKIAPAPSSTLKRQPLNQMEHRRNNSLPQKTQQSHKGIPPIPLSVENDERKRKVELRKARNREAAHRSNHKRKMAILKLKDEIDRVNSLEMTLRAKEKILREENAALRLRAQAASK